MRLQYFHLKRKLPEVLLGNFYYVVSQQHELNRPWGLHQFFVYLNWLNYNADFRDQLNFEAFLPLQEEKII